MTQCSDDSKLKTIKNEALNIIGLTDGVVDNYRGIPFAEAPIGELRFAPPVPKKPWKETLDCTKWGNSAMQEECSFSGHGKPSEDCLNLNIWAPAGAKEGDNHPVFVWIHGGGFYIGSGNQSNYDGTEFAKHGIILVTINYRLGALGFLSLKTLKKKYGYSGNWGLLDQICALKWVKENIRHFGGDADNVTIGGESAGSFSCACLVISPMTKGLFSKAILESGAYSTVLGENRCELDKCLDQGKRFAAMYGADDSEEGLEKLRKVDAFQLWKDSPFIFDVTQDMPMMMGPVYDGIVLPNNYADAMLNGDFNKDIKILAGNNAVEGALFIRNSKIDDNSVRKFVERAFLPKNVEPAMEVIEKYGKGCSEKEKLTAVISMTLIDLGLILFENAAAGHGVDVYTYVYGYCSNSIPPTHAVEMSMVFGSKISMTGQEKSKEDMEFTNTVHSYWCNFIKNGDPNGNGLVKWPKYTDREVIYLNKEITTGKRKIANELNDIMPLYFDRRI